MFAKIWIPLSTSTVHRGHRVNSSEIHQNKETNTNKDTNTDRNIDTNKDFFLFYLPRWSDWQTHSARGTRRWRVRPCSAMRTLSAWPLGLIANLELFLDPIMANESRILANGAHFGHIDQYGAIRIIWRLVWTPLVPIWSHWGPYLIQRLA